MQCHLHFVAFQKICNIGRKLEIEGRCYVEQKSSMLSLQDHTSLLKCTNHVGSLKFVLPFSSEITLQPIMIMLNLSKCIQNGIA